MTHRETVRVERSGSKVSNAFCRSMKMPHSNGPCKHILIYNLMSNADIIFSETAVGA